MPEPEVQETGFVPGSEAESGPVPVANGEPKALSIGREFIGELMGLTETPDSGDNGDTEPTSDSESEPAPTTQESTSSEPAPSTSTSRTERTTEASPEEQTYTLNQEQLDRLVQAETDRRETVRSQRQARQERSQQNKTKLDRLRTSGDLEGFAAEYAAQESEEAQLEQTAAQRQAQLAETAKVFDVGLLDPVMLRLPVDVRQNLLQTMQPVGIQGRSALLSAAIDKLIADAKEAGKAEGATAAEAALRKNQAFRKQLLVENRQQEVEPEIISSNGRGSAPTDMNEWVDNLLGRRRG